ncbi:MAG: DUF2207 domain-containing protein [bacterium]|nr:DUF2207 domain-containing protein [bacterium]
MKINKDGTVKIHEEYVVSALTKATPGIYRSLKDQFNQLKLKPKSIKVSGDVKDFYAHDDSIALEFKNKSKKKQTFTLSYTVNNIIIPFFDGAAFVWKTNTPYGFDSGSVEVEFPAAFTVKRKKIVQLGRKNQGNLVSVKKEYSLQGNKLKANLPTGIQRGETLEIFLQFTPDSSFTKNLNPKPGIVHKKIDYTVAVNKNKTLDFKTIYEVTSSKTDPLILLNLPRYFNFATALDKPGGPLSDRILYSGFDGPYTIQWPWEGVSRLEDGGLKKDTPKTIAINYSSLGNFHTIGSHEIVDIRVFPVDEYSSQAERVTLRVNFPESIKQDLVTMKLYQVRTDSYNNYFIEREMEAKQEWKENSLIVTYESGFFPGQDLLVRFILPSSEFSNAGFFTRYFMGLSDTFYFFNGPWPPVIFTLLFLIVLLIVYKIVRKKLRKGKSPKKSSSKKKAPKRREKSYAEMITENVKELDQEFNPDRFVSRSITIAERLQDAWSSGDMSPVRNYVSQGIYNRFRIQLELMRTDEGVRNIMSQYSISSARIIDYNFSEEYLSLHVMLRASAKDVTVPIDMPDEEAQKKLQNSRPIEFTEIYSFTRKKSAKSNADINMLKNQCPSCGTIPDNFSEVNRCESCGAIYNSGEYDWVLSEITQEEEWESPSMHSVDPLNQTQAKNLTINRQMIEDRASYLFWRWIYARARGDKTLVNRDAAEKFLNSFNPSKEYIREPVVGAVDLKAMSLVEKNQLSAFVFVKWSCSFAENKEPEFHASQLNITIDVGVENSYGFADHSCDSCGGPLPETDALKCDYCGGDLPVVVNDWLIESISNLG